MSDEPIFWLRLKNLGDQWSATTWMLRQSELSGRPVRLSRTGIEGGNKPWHAEPLVRRMVALLDSTGTIEYTDEPGNREVDYAEIWRRSLPTRQRWIPGRRVCLQLTGTWTPAEKNCPPGEAQILRDGLRELGCELIELGLPMTLEEGAAHLANCRYFIGVDSGYMHIAHSVGCPRILIRNKMFAIEFHHGGKNWTDCHDAIECLDLIRQDRLPSPGM